MSPRYIRRSPGTSYYTLLRVLARMRSKRGQQIISQTKAGQGKMRCFTVMQRLRFLKRMEYARTRS